MRPHSNIIVGICTPHHSKILDNRGEIIEGYFRQFPTNPPPLQPRVRSPAVTVPPPPPTDQPPRGELAGHDRIPFVPSDGLGSCSRLFRESGRIGLPLPRSK